MKMRFLGLFLLFISMSSAGAPIARTITVNWRGGADFTKVQDAINSVPADNKEWVQIYVKQGNYWEQIVVNRSFIFLQGEGRLETFLENSHALSTDESTAFDIIADNFVPKNIAFKNNHNYTLRLEDDDLITQAVAARVRADKVAFYSCSFISVQDTLWDDSGRHLYQSCYIKGTSGSGQVYLGRAWRPYARVLFYNTYLSENVAPQGWVAWYGEPNVNNLVFAESGCYGPGSNTTGRVPWEKTLSAEELNKLTNRPFIDAEGWIEQQP